MDEQNVEKDQRTRLAEDHLPHLPVQVTDRVYALAYEHGHASGEQEVAFYYSDFAELAELAYGLGRASSLPPAPQENWNPNTSVPNCDWCGECEWCLDLGRASSLPSEENQS